MQSYKISKVLFVLILALLSATPVLAATLHVTTLADGGAGSLRQAIADANPGDTIDFNLSYPATITLTSGELVINKHLTIIGPGANLLAISGNNLSRVFFLISAPITVNISGLSIEKGFGSGIFSDDNNHKGLILTLSNCTVSGNSAGVGGGIFNNGGTMTVINTTVSGNSSGDQGGGIFNGNTGSTLTLINSVVSGNTATTDGGGIFTSSFNTLTMIDSTVTGNFAGGNGGGILNNGTLRVTHSLVSGNSASSIFGGGGISNTNSGMLTVINSTVSGNSASFGGGISNFHSGTVTLSNSTVSGNSANQGGGGIYSNGGSLNLKNTIIANSPSGGNCVQAGTSTSHGHNLSDDNTCSSFFTGTGDLNNTPAGLDSSGLQNNGGPTRTIALLATSPAVDAVPLSACTDQNSNPLSTDQRGVSRPQGSGCDIGSVERTPNCGTSQAQIETYDLASDWSETSNPNGVWSYNEGLNQLPLTSMWYGEDQPGWAYCCNSPGGFGHVPVWLKWHSTRGVDFQAGDVFVHSSDSGRGENFGPANVTWTSPSADVITISGSAWISRETDRSNRWTLYLNGNSVSSGQLLGGGPYNRSNQFNFSAGSGGAAVLTNISVSAGDVVKLEVTKLSTFGDFVGVNLRITSSTCTPIDTTPPVITCPANINVASNVAGSCSAAVDLDVASATDNSSSVSVAGVRSDGQPLNAPYALGTTTIHWTATDAAGNESFCDQLVTVTNPGPVPMITGPPTGSIYAVNTPVTFTGTFTDNFGGMHNATWMFDDTTQSASVVEPFGSTPGSANTTFTFTTSGVYLISLTVDDGCGGTGVANTVDGITAMVVVYDPDGGYVTGGGWINSPVGAYQLDQSLIGKANFGFVSKYQHGASVPTGQTEFQFKVANLNFHSTVYEWLVVGGARAQFKGTGSINGSGNYGFLLTAIDGQVTGGGEVDKFRIKIWDKNNGDAIVYDNKMGSADNSSNATELGGGRIVIHQ